MPDELISAFMCFDIIISEPNKFGYVFTPNETLKKNIPDIDAIIYEHVSKLTNKMFWKFVKEFDGSAIFEANDKGEITDAHFFPKMNKGV